jgi:uncharacterized protein YjbJ (UPF0337 family)
MLNRNGIVNQISIITFSNSHRRMSRTGWTAGGLLEDWRLYPGLRLQPGHSIQRRFEMNWDQIEGKWKQSMGKVKEKWGKLTDDDLITINGKKDQLVGKVQERYGIAKDAAEKQVDEFTRSYNSDDSAKAAKSS